MNVLIAIQARSSSTRFPNKIFEKIGGKTVLERIYETCKIDRFKNVLKVEPVVLCPTNDQKVIDFCETNAIPYFKAPQGVNEADLVERIDYAAVAYDADFIVRITSDCPLLEKKWIIECIRELMEHDYVSNTIHRTVLDGQDTQGITRKAWDWYKEACIEREHVFVDIEQDYAFRYNFMQANFKVHALLAAERVIPNPYHPDNKISLDTPSDLERINKIYEQMAKKS